MSPKGIKQIKHDERPSLNANMTNYTKATRGFYLLYIKETKVYVTTQTDSLTDTYI